MEDCRATRNGPRSLVASPVSHRTGKAVSCLGSSHGGTCNAALIVPPHSRAVSHDLIPAVNAAGEATHITPALQTFDSPKVMKVTVPVGGHKTPALTGTEPRAHKRACCKSSISRCLAALRAPNSYCMHGHFPVDLRGCYLHAL